MVRHQALSPLFPEAQLDLFASFPVVLSDFAFAGVPTRATVPDPVAGSDRLLVELAWQLVFERLLCL